MIEAKVIADSIGQHSPRLFTIRTVYPKFLHQETLRHRRIYIEDQLRGDNDFSLSVSSARAIPFAKLADEAQYSTSQARPVLWGAEKKGMSPGDECEHPELAHDVWRQAALHAVAHAKRMERLGVHKSIVNRIIEPYIHVHALMTATEPGWMNFFGLRLDQAADPTLRALAEEIWKVWCESEPQVLQSGQWHLPFITKQDDADIVRFLKDNPKHREDHRDGKEPFLIRISVARCARLSYDSFETGKRSTIEEDLKLYERLVGSTPIHASPAEHQATPDTYGKAFREHDTPTNFYEWKNKHLHGNLSGWIQYRKQLPGESLAPLPEAYRK